MALGSTELTSGIRRHGRHRNSWSLCGGAPPVLAHLLTCGYTSWTHTVSLVVFRHVDIMVLLLFGGCLLTDTSPPECSYDSGYADVDSRLLGVGLFDFDLI